MDMIATRDAYGDVLVELGRKNKDVVVLDADLSGSTKTGKFAKEFPDRFFNMGISEQDMIATAAGLALGGKIPFASTFAIFGTGRSWEQLRQSVCYPNLNVKLVASHGGITVGEDGASHQSTEDLALTRVLPNMTVILPADAVETKKALEAVCEYIGPVYLRVGRPKVPVIFGKDYRFHIGKAHVLTKGTDATIIATGIMVYHALQASERLAEEGYRTGVVNMSTIKPIDARTVLQSAEETGAIVTAEEHSIIGGLGSAVAELLGENMPVPLKRIGIRDKFGTSGRPDELLKFYGLTTEDIIIAVREAIKRK